MLKDYRKNLCAAVGSSAGPYGYTLATWTTGAAITNARHPGHARRPLVHGWGRAGLRLRRRARLGWLDQTLRARTSQALLWGSFHVFSLGLAIGAAALVVYFVQSILAWPLAAFLSTTVYLLVLGAESTAAYGGITGKAVERLVSLHEHLPSKASLPVVDNLRRGIQLQHLLRREE